MSQGKGVLEGKEYSCSNIDELFDDMTIVISAEGLLPARA